MSSEPAAIAHALKHLAVFLGRTEEARSLMECAIAQVAPFAQEDHTHLFYYRMTQISEAVRMQRVIGLELLRDLEKREAELRDRGLTTPRA